MKMKLLLMAIFLEHYYFFPEYEFVYLCLSLRINICMYVYTLCTTRR